MNHCIGIIMNATDWHYVGEGGEHALFAYRQPVLSSDRNSVESNESVRWKGRLLRLDKKDIARSSQFAKNNNFVCASSKKPVVVDDTPSDDEDPLWFLRHVVAPYFGHYFDFPGKVELSWSFLSDLKEATLKADPCPIPESRREMWISSSSDDKAPGFAKGWLVYDYRYITNCSNEHLDEPCISVEIKPKAGYLATSPLVHPDRSAKFRRPRFVLLQELDRLGYSNHIQRGWKANTIEEKSVRETSGQQLSLYNPMNLFSGNHNDIRQSLASLWECPQNNFKLWYVPAISAEANSKERSMLIHADKHYLVAEEENDNTRGHYPLHWRDALHQLFVSPGTNNYIQCGQQHSSKDLEREAFNKLIADIFLAERKILEKILTWQQLDSLDGDGAVAVYQRLVELCHGSHTEAQELLDHNIDTIRESDDDDDDDMRKENTWNFIQASPFHLPMDGVTCPAFAALCEELDRFSSNLSNLTQGPTQTAFLQQEHAASRQFCLRRISEIESKHACCYLLQNWLLSLAMSDVSFFVTVQEQFSTDHLPSGGIETSDSIDVDVIKLDPDKITTRVVRQQISDHPGLIELSFHREGTPGVSLPNLVKKAFQYQVKLIDCDRKPANKLNTREKKEQIFEFLRHGYNHLSTAETESHQE